MSTSKYSKRKQEKIITVLSWDKISNIGQQKHELLKNQ